MKDKDFLKCDKMTEREFLEYFLNSLYADNYLVHHDFSRSSASNDELDEQIDKFLAAFHKQVDRKEA